MGMVVATRSGTSKGRSAGLVTLAFSSRSAFCTADDHPEESFPAPINSSHVVIDAYAKAVGEDTVLINDWLVFNTSKGKDLQGLVEAGASFGTSIEASVSSMKTLRKSRIMTSLIVTQWGTRPLVHWHLRNNLGLLSNQ